MKIVIGVPVHNCSGFTKYILEDFLEHNTLDHEITFVIVDNGSTDDTQELCSCYAGINYKIASNVTFIYERFEDNPGCSKSFNKIYEYLDREKADLCILINNDIVLSKNWLNQLVEFHKKNPEVGIFSPYLIDNHISPETVKEWFGDVRNNQGKIPSPEWQKYVDNTLIKEKNHLSRGMQGPMMVITRECRDAVGNWDEGFEKGCYDDIDYQLRARNLGFMTYVTGTCIIFHFGGSTQWFVTTFDKDKDNYRNRNKAYFEKKWKVNTSGMICNQSLFWKQPSPGVNILMEFPTPNES